MVVVLGLFGYGIIVQCYFFEVCQFVEYKLVGGGLVIGVVEGNGVGCWIQFCVIDLSGDVIGIKVINFVLLVNKFMVGQISGIGNGVGCFGGWGFGFVLEVICWVGIYQLGLGFLGFFNFCQCGDQF